MNKRKVVIIGAGHVGSHCAMALAFGGVCEEIVLLDTDLEKARANAMDVADACLFTPGSCTVHVGNYDDCKTADIIVISVGQPRKPGQTRLDMLDDSVRMLQDVCSHLKPLDYQGIVITLRTRRISLQILPANPWGCPGSGASLPARFWIPPG